MIVSVSRRCDIPAWGMDAFMADLAAGFRLVPNPFDARKARRVSLAPEDVDCLVFWTRNTRAILEREAELRARGYPFIVQVTITGYPQTLEPGVPEMTDATEAMRELASRIGNRRIAWRYDPVIATSGPRLDASFHGASFAAIADSLAGAAGRVIVSLIDEYGATRSRLARAGYPDVVFASPRGSAVGTTGAPGAAYRAGSQDAAGQVFLPSFVPGEETAGLRLPQAPYPAVLEALAGAARERGLVLQSCAEDFDLEGFGIRHGACIDGDLIGEISGKDLEAERDKGQRHACLCAKSVDIGVYGPCPAACAYCYARR